MPVVIRQVTIEAPREAVWATLADIGSVSQWNPVVTHSVETSDEGREAGIGSARQCDLPGSIGAIEEVVTGWDELTSMEYEVSGAKMIRFDLESTGDATRVTMRSEFSMILGPVGALMAATMGRRMMGQNMDRTLDGLKAHVESARRPEGRTASEERGATALER